MRGNKHIVLGLATVLMVTNFAISQPANPRLQHFFPDKHIGVEETGLYITPQNYDVFTDPFGILYVSNSSGIISFDGKRWNLVAKNNFSEKSKLISGPKGNVYLTNGKEFGYLTMLPDSNKLSFYSLEDDLTEKNKPNENFQWLISGKHAVFFVGTENIFRWNPTEEKLDAFPVISGKIKAIEYVDNKLYILPQKGDFKLDHADELLAEILPPIDEEETGNVNLLINISDRASPEIYLFAPKEEIYFLKDGIWALLKQGFGDQGNSVPINKAIVLHDGNFAIATGGKGILILDQNGKLLSWINQEKNGLSSNIVHSLFQDKENGIWLALNNGLCRIEYPYVLHHFSKDFDLDRFLVTSLKWKDYLYIGSLGDELFKLPYDNIEERSAQISKQRFPESVKDIWDLTQSKDQLLVGTSSGIFILNDPNTTPVKIGPSQVVFKFQPSEIDPSKIFVTWWNRSRKDNQYGIGLLSNEKGRWSYIEDFALLNHEVRDIAEGADGVLWASYIEVSKIEFDPKTWKIIRSRPILLSDEQKDKFISFEVFKWKDQIYFGTENGILIYDEKKTAFVQDSTFGHSFYKGEESAYAVTPDEKGGLWLTTIYDHQYLSPENVASKKWDKRPLSPVENVWSFYPENDRNVWIAANNGLYRYDPSIPKDYDIPFNTFIREVKSAYGAERQLEGKDSEGQERHGTEIEKRDTTLFGGFFRIGENKYQYNSPQDYRQVISYTYRNIRFQYAASSYEYPEKTEYSYQLEGDQAYWSDWSEEAEIDFPYLQEGDYTFHVKARNIYGTVGSVASYSFRILPPWYRSSWAYSFYGLALLALIYSIFRFWADQRRIEKQAFALAQERQAQERLKAIDKLKDQFLANTSHELRTPLHGIIGIAETLQDGAAGPLSPELNQNIEMIISSGKRLSSLVNDLLDFSKLKNRDLLLEKKACGLYAISDLVVRACEVLIRGKDLVLTNHISRELPQVYVDENRVQQVLYNLVGNAIKFTEKGQIDVSAEVHGNMIHVSVMDTGTGVPEEKRALIFREFEQLDGSTTRGFTGTGLGLSISKHLLELHGGNIWLESEVGKGSTFFFSIPIATAINANIPTVLPQKEVEQVDQFFGIPLAEDAALDVEEITAVPLIENGIRTRILIVDDEPINHQVLNNLLKPERFDIVSAMNGQEALDILEEAENFDLVLLDVMMPRMSGYDVCARIREKYLPSELPVLMVTAKDQVLDLVTGFKSGANDYISKPFTKDEFMVRLETHLTLQNINTATRRFVPSDFIRSLGKEQITEVNLGDHVEKEVTVLFTDIRDYTSLSETMTPEENFQFVNAYSERMGPVIDKHNGFVNQYLGDGIMALFLYGPEDALKAAIEMQNVLSIYNEERKHLGRRKIAVAMGMHTGNLIMGVIGDNRRNDAATISDTVNSASRMEGLAKYYGAKILLSEQSLEQIENKDQFHHRFLGKVKAKGKQTILSIYEFYDGDSPESIALKARTKEEFDNGLQFYFDKDFAKAIEAFSTVCGANPKDAAAKRLLEKAIKYLKEGVENDWDGVEMMEMK